MNNKLVTLDLRGTKFKVLKETFAKLNLDKVEHIKISDNEYYISRNASFFPYVLDFIEYGTLQCTESIRTTIRLEFEVYGLCNCIMNGCPFTCRRSGILKFQKHKEQCNKGPYEDNHKDCNW